MRLRGPGCALLLAFAPFACSGDVDQDDFLGDHSFTITETCPPNVPCIPACTNNGPDDVCGQSIPPSGGGCWITGIGYIVDADGHDNFGGNGMGMKDGSVRGEWEHVDHGTGDKFHGQVQYLFCRQVPEPGPGQPSGPDHNFLLNQAYYGGPGRWFVPGTGWQDGFWFDVMAEDHGEPGNKPGPMQHGGAGPDFYHFTARQFTGGVQSGTPVIVYDTAGDIVGGNFQIHPPNNGHPFVSSPLPPWVDGNQP
ncbi:MAG TPA: hypothetical protein VKN99_19005 [Polyangia bacterium]|nr:hypothetical protein [Polyangia bacterium]